VPLYLVGGSWRAFARYAIDQLGWPLDDPHGFELSPKDARSVCRSIAQGKFVGGLPRISSSRLASLPDAAALLGALLREIGPSKLVFSSWGLREGLLYQKLPPAVQAQDPMLAGVAAFAWTYGVSAAAATRITGWTAPLVQAGEADERLRLAATLLALAAMQIEPNLRTEQAISWALRKRWIGLDARGRAMVAIVVLANSGDTAIPPELAGLATAADFRQAIGWGLAVRLCRKLTGCTAQGLASTTVSVDEGQLKVVLHDPMHALYSNAIGKDHRLLADWFGLEPTVELLPAA
jgi:exopolyphosphatase/guanosine-5'-triphosphate,3'-diphosphate pyrophosphatase